MQSYVTHCQNGTLFNSHLFKVLLLLLRVGVVKAHDKLALKGDLVVLVEQSGLSVAYVQIPESKDKM